MPARCSTRTWGCGRPTPIWPGAPSCSAGGARTSRRPWRTTSGPTARRHGTAMGPDHTRLQFRNRLLMVVKNETRAGLRRDGPRILGYEVLALGYAAAARAPSARRVPRGVAAAARSPAPPGPDPGAAGGWPGAVRAAGRRRDRRAQPGGGGDPPPGAAPAQGRPSGLLVDAPTLRPRRPASSIPAAAGAGRRAPRRRGPAPRDRRARPAGSRPSRTSRIAGRRRPRPAFRTRALQPAAGRSPHRRWGTRARAPRSRSPRARRRRPSRSGSRPGARAPMARLADEHERQVPRAAGQRGDALARVGGAQTADPQQVLRAAARRLAHRRPTSASGRGVSIGARPPRGSPRFARAGSAGCRRRPRPPRGWGRSPARPAGRRGSGSGTGTGAQVLAGALERDQVMERHHHRHRAAEHRAVDPRRVVDLGAPRAGGSRRSRRSPASRRAASRQRL